jgi:ferric-dicitrate binding protein FerR (iron transport regulator)
LNENDFRKIGSYINGESDEKEKTWAESLFLDGENNSTLRYLLEKDWELMPADSATSKEQLNHLLDRINHHIGKKKDKKMKSIFVRFTMIYMRAAAILLLPLLVAGVLGYSYISSRGLTTDVHVAGSSIYAPLGARVNFILPDGTTGMLNSGSKLSYSLPFTNNRNVILEGEAWFEVNHDKDHPFEINTGNSVLKVLGTSFNVNAYPVENYVEVVLLDGKVQFFKNNSSDSVTLLPSERLIFQNGNIRKSVTDPLKYNAWTQGKLVFRGDPMAEVARRIERWYNVKVSLADKALEKYSFRAIFLDEPLDDVLMYLSMTSPIRYSIAPRELMQDGTYGKQEVTIYLEK